MMFLRGLILSICIWLSVGQDMQATETKPYITLDLYQVSLQEVLSAIEMQSGYVFSYESSLLKALPPVSIRVEQVDLAVCLKRLLSPLSLDYTLAGNYIILKRKKRLVTIRGFIRDSASMESLINATLVEQGTKQGTFSNNYGFYSLTLPPGLVMLQASYTGFSSRRISFDLQRDTVLDWALPASGQLTEIVVEGLNPNSEVLSSRTGCLAFSSHTIKRVPALFGEPDLCRTLQQTPGVSPGTEGLTGLYVRGGNGDENLYLVDGNPIYHINHIGGLFSTFNPDVVKNVEFYKGSFPARYGGRLSSVVDVRMKDGDMQQYHGGLSVGLLAATANLEGPIWKDRTSFNVAFRRTWLDVVTIPMVAVYNRKNKDHAKAGYSFYDLNGKINHLFSDRSRMYMSVYAGQDRVRWAEMPSRRSYKDLKWRWGNFVGSLHWNYLFSPDLFADFTVTYSQYQARMWDLKEKFTTERLDLLQAATEEVHGSYIRDMGYRADFDYMPLPSHRIKFGSDYLYHQYRPEQHWVTNRSGSEDEQGKQQIVYANQWIPAHEASLYAEDDWLLSERWKLNVGMRLTAFAVQQQAYLSLQPRASIRYLINRRMSAKLSYAKMNQYLHQLSNSYMNLPSDIWVPVTKEVRPMSSRQLSGGLYYTYQKWLELSLEGYYKRMNHLIEYQDGASLFPAYTRWDDKISMGEGRSYGMEAMVKKVQGDVTGWIGYTLAWADRCFPNGMVNGGKRFPARYDNRHKLNVAVSWRPNQRVELSASWMYMSGNRITVAVDSYLPIRPESDPVDPEGTFSKPFAYEPIFRRNAVRLGDYHRLDVGVNVYRHTRKGAIGIWNVSLYNAYCRLNPFAIESLTRNSDGSWRFRQKGYVPLMPSVSYTYKF